MELIRHIRIKEGTVFSGDAELFHSGEKEFRLFARKLYKDLGVSYPKFYKMSALSQLGFLASELLLDGLDLSNLNPEEVSLVFANASSSSHADILYQDSLRSTPSPALFVYTLPNIVIGEICIRNKFRGEGVFFIQDSFDKEFIFDQAEALISSGRSSLCLSGWLEMDMKGVYLADLYLLSKKEINEKL